MLTEGFTNQIRTIRSWLASAGRLGAHPDQIAQREESLAKSGEFLAAAEAKLSAERDREATRLVTLALSGSAGGVVGLERAAASVALHGLASALRALGGDVAQRAGLEREIAEYPDFD